LYVSVVVVGSGLSTIQTQIGNSTLSQKKKHSKFNTNLKMQIHVENSTLRIFFKKRMLTQNLEHLKNHPSIFHNNVNMQIQIENSTLREKKQKKRQHMKFNSKLL
jgi:hypothetical protein